MGFFILNSIDKLEDTFKFKATDGDAVSALR